MSQQATLFDTVDEANLTVSEREYFGEPLDRFTPSSRQRYGLGAGSTLYRHSYLFHVDYPISTRGGDGSEVGAIELRARTWTRDAEPSDTLRSVLKATAHRAAQLFDTSIQNSRYEGYLTGFNVINPGSSWESEKVAGTGGSQAQLGKIDWNVEVYDKDKNLSGIAQGIANPWTHTVETVPGREPVHVAPHKWKITFNETREGGTYDVHPSPRSKARQRYKKGGAGTGKRVHINGRAIGKLDSEGRTWLTPQYARGDGHSTSGSFGTYYSRKGLIAETEATAQALRKGGTLYHVGETEEAVYLRTSRALPDDYEAADPDSVSVGAEVVPGREGRTIHILGLRTPEEPTPVTCRRDETVIRHLGYSLPSYSHAIATGWVGP